MTNNAPTGSDNTILVDESAYHRFRAEDFGFNDADGDSFAGLIFTDSSRLFLDLQTVAVGQFIAAADIPDLEWLGAGPAGPINDSISFQVVDDGGTADDGQDTDQTPNVITFKYDDEPERVIGTRGKDCLVGTYGPDRINGRGGNDILVGLDGDDIFVFGTKSGKDTVTDFSIVGPDLDVIDLTGAKSISSFRDLRVNHLEQHGDDAWIVLGRKDILIVTGVDVTDVHHDNVII